MGLVKYKHEDSSLSPQHPSKYQVKWQGPVTLALEVENKGRRSLEFTGQAA